MKTYIMILLCLTLFGCGAGDGTGLDQDGQPLDPDAGPPEPQPPVDPDALQPNLASIQEKVLTPICTQCHAGGNAPLGLRMDDLATSEANLINVDSATNPQFRRVEPGDAEQSFFYLKIIGDPSAGNQMPLGQSPLPTETQQIIRTWIDSGAPIEAGQATVAAKHSASADGKLTINLNFSQPMNRNTLNADEIKVSVLNADGVYEIQSDLPSLEWLSDRRLAVKLSAMPTDASKVQISLNQPNVSSIFSQSGVWLDGDYDGLEGGEVHYEYTINQ